MPVRIPVYQDRQTPSGFGVVPQASAPEVSNAIARGMAKLGAAAEYATDRYMAVQEKERLEFDTLRAEDAYNQLRAQQTALMMDPEKGFLTKRGADAIAPDVVPTYLGNFQKATSDIESKLTSDQQRKLFRARALNAQAEYRNALSRHVLDQSNSYARDVFTGTLSVESDNAARDWQNPYTVQMAMERIDGAVMRENKRLGIVGDEALRIQRDARSLVHSKVLEAALDNNNVAYAQAYLKQNASQLNATDLLKYQGMVTKEYDARVALGTASQVVREYAPAAMPDDFQRLAGLVERRESGSLGQGAVSPAGAIGVMQVMPGTGPEAAKLAGLPWNETQFKTDAAYNRKLGQAYLRKQLQDFNGDVPKALAAYNAGPGRVQDAIKRANRSAELNKNDPSVKVFNWLDLLPKETRDYVVAIVPQFTNGQGAPDRPTLQQVHDSVRQRVGADNPQRLKLALDEATRQWSDLEKASKAREDQSLDRAYKWLELNGGKYEAMPASLRSQIPGDKIGTVRDFAAKISEGQPVQTDWDAYYPLRTDMALLAKTNLGALKGVLAPTEFKELVKLQEDIKSGDGQSRVMNTSQRMNLRLTEMGVDPTPKPGHADAKKVSKVYGMLDQNLRAAEAALGRKLKPEEIDNEVDRLFTSTQVKGTLYGTNERRLFELKPEDVVVSVTVPDAERAKITRALQRNKQPVTEEAIQHYYRKGLGL